uniref:Uncharacterized protein n=1 Tax=Acrobeloides nanus TaxID=290746 RepID=A0A914DAR6_9BILA
MAIRCVSVKIGNVVRQIWTVRLRISVSRYTKSVVRQHNQFVLNLNGL